MRRFSSFIALVVGCLAVLFGLCAVADASYIGHQYALAQKTSGSQWDGVRTYMEVRNGEISSSDAAAGYFIENTLWVYTDGTTGSEWVEAGYTRGWNSQDIMTGYWASQRWSESQGRYVYDEHKAVNCTWTGGDWHWFKIMHHNGTTQGDCDWRVFIDGDPVVSGDGVSITTSHKYSWSQMMDVGLEAIASSGKLGASSNWCRLYNLGATTDEQASWSDFNNPTLYLDQGYNMDRGWQSYPTDFKDYRNW